MKKVIIVTGASSGIGKATALQLIKEGHTVYGGVRRVEKMDELLSAGGKAIAIDVTNHNQVHDEIQKIIESEGKIDVLVNNAGYAVYGPIEEISYEKAKQQFDANLFGLNVIIVEPGSYSEPTVIAHTITKAINAKRPKAKYAAGKMARETLLVRKLLSDKGFDRMFLSMVKNYGEK